MTTTNTQPIDITVQFCIYNAFGGHTTLSLIGDFLMLDAPSFGEAIKEIEAIMYFRSVNPPRRTLESSYEEFHAGLAHYPLVTFRRKNQTAQVLFVSDLVKADKIYRDHELSLELFNAATPQVVEHLKLLRKRIRKDDDFNFPAFEAWLNQRQQQLPTTLDELTQIRRRIRAQWEAAQSRMSEWDKLALDWEDFHPDARTILDDPRLWDITDDWSPNGNDTGADILTWYAEWRPRNRQKSPERFWEQLLKQYGIEEPNDSSDKITHEIYHEAALGHAFAQLKIDGTCEVQAAQRALATLDRQPENELTGKIRSVLTNFTSADQRPVKGEDPK